MGLGDNVQRNSPCKLNFNFPNIKLISCGAYFTIVLTDDNTLYVWGKNMRGELGLGDNTDRHIPQKLAHKEFTEEKIKSITCGESFTIVSTFSNKLYSWGENCFGELGLGDTNTRYTPTNIKLSDAKSISCGRNYTIVLTIHNTLYVWGYNYEGQLGLGDNRDRMIPCKLELHNIKSITCRGYHTIAVTNLDTIYVWGYNYSGELGLGDNQNRYSPHKLDFKF